MHEVVLCADDETMRDPSLIGLQGESLESQRWLHPISSANEARRYLSSGGSADEVWVASSNEVDPINLAAALKRDRADRRVCLVAWQESGSLMSRASAAGIDEVLGYREMASRYAQLKRQQRAVNPRRRTPERAIAEQRRRQDAVAAGDGASRRDGLRGRDAGAYHDIPDPFGDPELVFAPDPVPSPAPHAVPVPTEGSAIGSAGSAPAPAASGKRGYALAIVSASGGTGKSTVAALSALISAGHGYRTVLIDADLQFGDVAAMMGELSALPVDRVVADPRCMEAASPLAGRPVVVSAPELMERSELYLPQVPGLIDRARDSFDVVVVNTGSFWTESHVQMMECCSNTLFLMDQRPTSVNAARRALELCSRCGVAAHPFLFAVNRCSRNSPLSAIDVSCALNGVSVAELKDGGRPVSELMGAGLAQQLVEERNDLCISLNDFLGQVVPAAVGDRAGKVEDAGKAKRRRSRFRRKGKAA